MLLVGVTIDLARQWGNNSAELPYVKVQVSTPAGYHKVRINVDKKS